MLVIERKSTCIVLVDQGRSLLEKVAAHTRKMMRDAGTQPIIDVFKIDAESRLSLEFPIPSSKLSRNVCRDPNSRSLSQDLAQARSLADFRCQDEAIAERGLRLGSRRCSAQNTHPDPGRGRRRLTPRARGGVLWSARWRQGGRRHGWSPVCPTRGAPVHHARWLGPTVSWDHDPHRTAPADHHGIPRFSPARGHLSRRQRK